MAEMHRILKLGPKGEVALPDDVLEALDVGPGGELRLFLDTRRRQVRLERHVADAWEEALRRKPEKGLEDVLGEQVKREQEAKALFEKRLKKPPPKRKPEEDPDYWR